MICFLADQEHYLAVISKKTDASITALKAKLAGEKTVNQQLRKTKIDKEKPAVDRKSVV